MKMGKQLTNIFDKAISKFGKQHQSMIAIEEMAELQKEITKNIRYGNNREHIIEEVADVEIMLYQLKKIHNISDNEICSEKLRKANRLKEILEKAV